MQLRYTPITHSLAIAATLIISGCATQAPLSAQATAAQTTKRDSEFDRFAVFSAPEVFLSVPRGMLADRVRWKLQSIVDKPTSAKAQSVLISIWHQDKSWRYYQSASFIGGDLVNVKHIKSEPNCTSRGGFTSCSFTEIVSVSLPTERWTEAQTTGLSIRFNAKNGPSVTIQVPADYAQGFSTSLPKR